MATWHNAHFSCRDKGGQLLALESEWEDGTIKSFLNRQEFGKYSARFVTDFIMVKMLNIRYNGKYDK